MVQIPFPRWHPPQVTACREARRKWHLTLLPRWQPSQVTVWSGRKRKRMMAKPLRKVPAYKAVVVADENCQYLWGQCCYPQLPPATWVLDSASVSAVVLCTARVLGGGKLVCWHKHRVTQPQGPSCFAKFPPKQFLVVKCSLSKWLPLQA